VRGGGGGLWPAKPVLRQESAAHGSVAQQRYCVIAAARRHGRSWPLVEEGILELVCDDGHARSEQFLEMQRVEIGHTETRDLACALQSIQLESCFHVARQGEVPPVKLHEVETLHAEPCQGSIDDGFDAAAVQCLQLGQIGYELRMHL